MSVLRIGIVEYINALPFAYPLVQEKVSPFLTKGSNKYTVTYDLAPPSSLNNMLKKHLLQGALTSSLVAIEQECVPCNSFGIAADGEILSVLFYHQIPLHALTGARIGVTSESATSVALLKILCHHFWNISPKFECLDSNASSFSDYAGILLIGDRALKSPHIEGFSTIDLGSAWKKATGLPFVFALLAFQTTLEPFLYQQLFRLFEDALAWSECHTDCVLQEAQRRSSLSKEVLSHYYQACRYRLDTKEWQGLELFQQLYQSLHKDKLAQSPFSLCTNPIH